MNQIKPAFLVIEGLDYFVESEGDRNFSLAETFLSRSLRKLAKEFNIPVLCSLAIAPGPEKRADKRPMSSDLSGWHGLEEDVDQLIFMYREDAYISDLSIPGLVEFIIAKNKRGLMGETIYVHSSCYGRFEETDLAYPLNLSSSGLGGFKERGS